MQTLAKLRVNYQTASELLDLSREGLRKLLKKDPTFPRPIKSGTHIQSPVYFDYQQLIEWHNAQYQNAINEMNAECEQQVSK